MRLFSSLGKKWAILANQVKYKGLSRAVKDIAYEQYYKRKFRGMGVFFPNYCDNLTLTNSKSVHKDSHENTTSSFYILSRAFKNLPMKAEEISLLDIGCGAGRVMSFGMFLKFRKVAGIDLDMPALEKAANNCKKMMEKTDNVLFEIEHTDACNYRIADDVNVIYMYNPFGHKTLVSVLENIMRHTQVKNKEIYLIYANPSFRDVFDQYELCKKIYQSHYKNRNHADLAIYRIGKIVESLPIKLFTLEGAITQLQA